MHAVLGLIARAVLAAVVALAAYLIAGPVFAAVAQALLHTLTLGTL